MTDAAQLQLITLVSLIVGFAYQAYRDTRQRRWDVEDRARLAIKADEQVAHAVTSRNEMALALAENTGLTKAAFAEANHVNIKIERLATSANAAIAAEQHGERRLSDAIRADLVVAKDLGLLTPKGSELA
jgi:coproporphyrinogen III oxidase-like Fe-S oxidoreductase